MAVDHREIAFENAIENHLLESAGYKKLLSEEFDREQAIFPFDFIEFVQETQPETWEVLEKIHGDNTHAVVIDNLCKNLDSQGPLTVLRHGFKCFGKTIRAAYFAPAHGLNPETKRLYDLNRLAVTRQLHFSTKNENSMDVVLSLNGIPLATAELKNPMSGQTVEHAKTQYCNDRDPRERVLEFKKRTLVHFAVDPDLVFMTTRLAGRSTRFLPFNLGDDMGAGNPVNPDGYRTAYLWEYVWSRDSWLDIVGRFIHLEVEEKRVGGRKIKKETMIFPRYHQLDCVRKLESDARANGVGTNYLVQHSAGSGKSNSIGWLSHRLASLHNDRDEILEAFKPYYVQSVVAERSDPQQLYDLQAKLGEKQIYYNEEVEAFCRVFFKPKERQSPSDHAAMNAALDPAVGRFTALDEDDREEFRSLLLAFRTLYSLPKNSAAKSTTRFGLAKKIWMIVSRSNG